MRALYPLFTVCLLITTACASGSPRMGDDPELRDRIRPLVEHAMDRGLATGLQVAVVTKDGRTWSEPFGLADAETGRPVTDSTRFYIASTAKAIMALTAARMDHRGELDLDASLAEAFPAGTRFHPDYDPTTATVRDLLTHTHGIQPGPASFLIAYTGQYTNEKLFELMPMHPPLPNRDFNYTNFGYDLMGLLLDPDEKRGWTEFEEAEVFEPLGLTRTTNYVSRLDESEIAMPHAIRAGGVQRVRLAKADSNIGPAGGQFTTADDLARFLMMELNHGRLDGAQVIPAEVIRETQRQQVPQDRDVFYHHRHGWGLGWDIGTYDGATLLQRSGGFSGYYSNAAFMPDHGFGVVVLSNGGFGGTYTAEILACAIYDVMRGRDDAIRRMDERLDDIADQVVERQRQVDAALAEVEVLDAPLRTLDEYVGRYRNPVMGTAEIVRTASGIEFRFGMIQSELTPQPAMEDGAIEPFFAELLDYDDQVRFSVGEDGAIESLAVRGTPLQFRRVR